MNLRLFTVIKCLFIYTFFKATLLNISFKLTVLDKYLKWTASANSTNSTLALHVRRLCAVVSLHHQSAGPTKYIYRAQGLGYERAVTLHTHYILYIYIYIYKIFIYSFILNISIALLQGYSGALMISGRPKRKVFR